MNSDELFEFYVNESKTKFEGWNFSYISGRLIDSPLPWNYRAIIIPYVMKSTYLLDIGTGGGEFLSHLPYPKLTFATESYEPNVKVATERLKLLGIQVQQIYSDSELPFENNVFDLIIDRHESYDVSEVGRVLKPETYFITQQVGRNDGLEINKELQAGFPEDDDPNWSLDFIVKQLEKENFTIIDAKEAKVVSRVYDIGALIYYLKAIPWQVPKFSVENYLPELMKLHSRMQLEGYFDYTSERLFVIAKKNIS